MANPSLLTNIHNIDELIKYMGFVQIQYESNREPIGFKINNSSSDAKVQRIDRNFNEVNPDPDFFYKHELFQFPKCILTSSGVATYSDYLNGYNRDGTHLDFTGVSGNLMAKIQNPKMRYEYDSSTGEQYYLFAPFDSNHPYFDYHPHCYSGGTIQDHFFLGCYEAGLKDDAGTLKLNSCSGVQPITGGCINSLAFTAGTVAFTVGETLTNTATGISGIVDSYHKSSGTWGSDAAGIVYLRQVTTGTSGAGTLNGSISGVNCASQSAASTVLNCTINDALTYAANNGVGWTISDIYSHSLLQGLFYTQFGTRNARSAIGLGITQMNSGVGYAGKLTGADSIDSLVNLYGTGSGNGVAGATPVSWNNLQNLWGNIWEFLPGISLMSDFTYSVMKPDGSGTISGVGTVPSSDGFLSSVKTDLQGATLFIPDAVTTTDSSSGFCSYTQYPRSLTSIYITSGHWYNTTYAGMGYRSATYNSGNSVRALGARLKYIPQS